MPTYEYKCEACGHTFEKFQTMTAPHIRKCPECGRSKVKRLIGTGAGLIFKGSGFYETDYRSDSYKKDAKADQPATAGETKRGGETKATDAKPAETAKPADTAKTTESKPAAPPEKKSGKSKDKSKS
jgi:putative FmdB family regulatory protein